jgi:digeranylgeranylglycerophospholipid reductase
MKVLIIGAGPIGCYTARLLKEKIKEVDIEIIEEHEKIGRPIHCAGLVSTDVFTQSQLAIDKNTIINHIDGAEFFLGDDSFVIERKDVAYVIDREKFDYGMGDGFKISLGTRFVGIEKEKGMYLVETDRGEYHADIVIGADGANSSLRRIGGFKEDIKFLRGVQFRMKYDKCRKNFVQVHIKSPFFAWLVPENEHIVRAGIISDNPYHDLSGFLKERNIEGEIIEKFAGILPLGKCSTQMGSLALVGDAACQVKPLTHGGIYYGMRCAEVLAECIAAGRISEYERQWQSRFGRELEIGLKIKTIYAELGSENLKRIFNLLKENKHVLEELGDFENHSKVIYALIKNTGLRSILGDILLHIFRKSIF